MFPFQSWPDLVFTVLLQAGKETATGGTTEVTLHSVVSLQLERTLVISADHFTQDLFLGRSKKHDVSKLPTDLRMQSVSASDPRIQRGLRHTSYLRTANLRSCALGSAFIKPLVYGIHEFSKRTSLQRTRYSWRQQRSCC